MAPRRLTLARAIEQVRLTYPCGRLLVAHEWGRSRGNSLQLADHELWLVWRGRGWMTDSQRRYELRPGFCVWMRPGGIYDAGVEEGGQLGFTYIHFRWPADGPAPPEYAYVRDVDFYEAAMRRIVKQIGAAPRPRWGDAARVTDEVEWLLRAVLASVAREATGMEPGDELTRKIRRIAADMRDQPERDIAVAEYARQCGVSAAHFSRAFSRAMGSGPQLFQIERRIEQARHLLRESNLPITQIARQLGYGDVYRFSRQFRKHMDLSPTQYRDVKRGL